MARRALVDLDIEGGRQLVEALDKSGFPVGSAFWIFDSESDEWRLVISCKFVDREGPLKAYDRIQTVLKTLPDIKFRLDNIAAVGTKDARVVSLRGDFHAGLGFEDRPWRALVNGVLEDVYIYRLE